MTIELTLGNAITIVALFIVALWALVKMIMAQQEKHLTVQFKALTAAMTSVGEDVRRQADGLAKMERDFLSFKAELPLHYVRREDYVQAVATLMAKIDAMTLRFENILYRGNTNER